MPPRYARSLSSFILSRSSFARRGFSFTELLFAVMILGIGFILIAAIFPVGLAQTKSNFDETHAASLARSGAAEVGRLAYAADFVNPSITPLQIFGDNTTAAATSKIARNNMISPSDPRYAWVGLYRRVTGSQNTAQLCLFLVNRSDPIVKANTISSAPNDVAAIEPRRVRLDISTTGIATISAPVTPQNGEQYNQNAAGPGGFVLIMNDNLGNNTDITDTNDRAAASGRLNGRVYRLGTQTGNAFEMFPGAEFGTPTFSWDADSNTGTPDKVVPIPSLINAQAYIVGRNRTVEPPVDTFDGPVMDVAYYTTFISLK